MSSLFSVFAYH